MSLVPGMRLGPHEILGAIGAGGMGEVYKARDTRLDRTVAIKVLPPEFSVDAERRARFQHEARAIAALAHPHICALYDIGESIASSPESPPSPSGLAAGSGAASLAPCPLPLAPVHYLVMEHLQGETLAERLENGPLPLAQALDIAAQIADALDAAHKHGIIHRDLKPGNVMLTKTGAKLLDFGLAKLKRAGAAAIGPLSLTAMPTQAPATAAGTLLGTVPYMAPEQLEGREADARSDIFAFGAVLYEMLAGARAFEGTSQASLISAIMTAQPPPLAARQPLTPPALDRVVRRCLAKDPDARWQTATDLSAELRWIAEPGSAMATPAAGGRASRARRVAVSLAAGVLIFGAGSLLGAAAWRALHPTPAPRVQRVTLTLSEAGLRSPSAVAIAPDGQTIAVKATEGNASSLYLRRLDNPTPIAMRGTENASHPRFSDDGEWIGMSPLAKVHVREGGRVPLGDSPWAGADGLAWIADGGVLFANPESLSITKYDAAGRAEVVVPVEQTNAGVRRPYFPEVLPGGNAILFNILEDAQQTIWAYTIRTGEKKRLPVLGTRPRYLAATGHLVYWYNEQLFAAPFDPETLSIATAAARPVLDEVGEKWDVSRNGTLAYLSPAKAVLVWKDRAGRTAPVASLPDPVEWITISRDGLKAVIGAARGDERALYLTRLDRDLALTRLNTDGEPWFPLLTDAGDRVLYTCTAEPGRYNICATRANGGGTLGVITRSTNYQAPSSVRGRLLLYNELHDGKGEIWQRDLYLPSTARRLVATPASEVNAVFSPDGRWIAYETARGPGTAEICVQGYPDGGRQVVSVGGGRYPVWHPKGSELFYSKGSAVIAVRIVGGARVGEPAQLFEISGGRRPWDVMPSGDRFLVGETESLPQVNLIQNWFEELKAKVPAR